ARHSALHPRRGTPHRRFRRDPRMNSSKALAQAAYDKLRLGDAPGAEKLLAPILAADPNNGSLLQLMGIICQAQNRIEDAVRYMRTAVKFEPNNAQYPNNIGV